MAPPGPAVRRRPTATPGRRRRSRTRPSPPPTTPRSARVERRDRALAARLVRLPPRDCPASPAQLARADAGLAARGPGPVPALLAARAAGPPAPGGRRARSRPDRPGAGRRPGPLRAGLGAGCCAAATQLRIAALVGEPEAGSGGWPPPPATCRPTGAEVAMRRARCSRCAPATGRRPAPAPPGPRRRPAAAHPVGLGSWPPCWTRSPRTSSVPAPMRPGGSSGPLVLGRPRSWCTRSRELPRHRAGHAGPAGRLSGGRAQRRGAGVPGRPADPPARPGAATAAARAGRRGARGECRTAPPQRGRGRPPGRASRSPGPSPGPGRRRAAGRRRTRSPSASSRCSPCSTRSRR